MLYMNTYEDFIRFTKEYAEKFKYFFNYENEEYLKEFYEELRLLPVNCPTNCMRSIKKLLSKKRNFQNGCSHRNVDYWKSFGFSEEESLIKVKNIQSDFGKIGWATPHKMKVNNPIFKEYWLARGYSDKEAGEKINPMHTNYRLGPEYRPRLRKKISETVKKIHRTTNIYDKHITELNEINISKEEICFFEYVKSLNIVHKSFGMNLNAIKTGKLYRIADGYLKLDDKRILVEYDGAYWHRNETVDTENDNKILLLRKDILGIIRVNSIYFQYNKETILEDLKNAIEKIKNNQERICKLYQYKSI